MSAMPRRRIISVALRIRSPMPSGRTMCCLSPEAFSTSEYSNIRGVILVERWETTFLVSSGTLTYLENQPSAVAMRLESVGSMRP